jgi:hypothetical protein
MALDNRSFPEVYYAECSINACRLIELINMIPAMSQGMSIVERNESVDEMNESVHSSATVERTLDEISDLLHTGVPQGYSAPALPQQTIAAVPPLHNFPTCEGWGLLISVEGVEFDYQFSRDDLQTVFQRYGQLTGVDSLAPEYPFGRVWFSRKQDALNAIRDLDCKILNGIHGRLRVVWDPDSVVRIQFHQNTITPRKQQTQFNTSSNLSSIPSSSTIHHRGISQASSTVRKFTCRIDIGIENDKEFQVARRIIGTKGCNMKKIVDVSNAKLRLRGKGSGYLEGPTQTESPEPLHICISCTNESGYSEAVKAVTGILESVYVDYKAYLQGKKRRSPNITVPDLKVTVQEMPLATHASTPEESSIDEEHFPPSPPQQRSDSGYWKVPS